MGEDIFRSHTRGFRGEWDQGLHIHSGHRALRAWTSDKILGSTWHAKSTFPLLWKQSHYFVQIRFIVWNEPKWSLLLALRCGTRGLWIPTGPITLPGAHLESGRGFFWPRRCHNQRQIALWKNYHHCVLTTNAEGKGSKSHPRFLTCPPGSSQPSLIAYLFSDVSSASPENLSSGTTLGF
jgi:hypothetical protein